MPLGTLLGDAEELGKKDDDYRTGGGDDLVLSDLFHMKLPAWKSGPRTTRRRRLVVVAGAVLTAAVVVLIVVLQHNHDAMPHELRAKSRTPYRMELDDLELATRGPASDARRLESEHAAARPPPPPPPPPPIHQIDVDKQAAPNSPARNRRPPKGAQRKGPPPVDPDQRDGRELQYYNGPMEWDSLRESLQESSRGWRSARGQNILFAAASLQSFARLAPMACEMARWRRTNVHFAVMGRHSLKMEELKKVNGIDRSCEVVWHDARPNYAAYSTDERFGLAVYHALDYIRSYLWPRVYIIDQPSEEEWRFIRSLEDQAAQSGRPVVRLPLNAVSSLKWVTRLDGDSLAAWNTVNIEILVRAPVGNAASLIRLLKSIQNADYFGMRPPRLTIELPPDVDHVTETFLENFVWPPTTPYGEQPHSQLTLRRRLPQQRIGVVEASLRLIESFYPARARNAHVLLLAAEVELSPLYYHYLFYNLLEYRYSSRNADSHESESLLGISLVSPTLMLDGKTRLIRPTVPVEDSIGDARKKDEEMTTPSPFLWQAPDTYATLYFGDKWKQIHSFFNLRLRRTQLVENNRIITSAVPAFAEYFLELMRAKGYFILYPHLEDYDFATAHNELYQPPEEFAEATPKQDGPPPVDADPFYHPGPASVPKRKESELAFTPLHGLLPSHGDLTALGQLPILSYSGSKLTSASATRLAQQYAHQFRTVVGKCSAAHDDPERPMELSAEDLFCESDETTPGLGSGFGQREPHRSGAEAKPGAGIPEDFQWVDENGDWLPLPVVNREKESMDYEFTKHLQRQKDRSD